MFWLIRSSSSPNRNKWKYLCNSAGGEGVPHPDAVGMLSVDPGESAEGKDFEDTDVLSPETCGN